MFERRFAVGAVAAVWVSVACASGCGGAANSDGLFADAGSDGTTSVGQGCVPGQQIACTCPGGATGAQVCVPDGHGYGVCQGCAGEVDGTLPLADASSPLDSAVGADAAAVDAGADAALDAAIDTGADARDGSSGMEDAADGGTNDANAAGDVNVPADANPVSDANAPADAPVDGADSSCAGVILATSREPVAMVFVLDGSGSMDQDNKWTAATAALTAIFNDMATRNDPGVLAGLIVFSDTNDTTVDGPYPGANDVPIAQVDSTQAAKLVARYSGGDMPNGDTPTGEALGVTGSTFGTTTGGYHELATLASSASFPAGGKKVLILITDGVPTDTVCATPGTAGYDYTTNACIAYAGTELASAAASGGPIETFAIGAGVFPSPDITNFDPSFLGYLAQAGGSAAAGCTPSDNTSTTGLCYFEVDPSGSSSATQAAFEGAINQIRGEVVSCTFAFAASDAGAIDPSDVYVTLGGAPVPADPTNGWTFDSPSAPTSVTLHGTSCATAKANPTETVDVVLGCPAN